jgi:asparagine synthase (glutamine-hydrolysing)
MCSILALLDLQAPADELRPRALELSRAQRHRGPDWSGVWSDDRAILAHERLAIVGVEDGAQPLVGGDGRYVLAVNGEIYNHAALAEGLSDPYDFATASDCEVLIPLFMEQGTKFLPNLNGIFAFVLYDRDDLQWVVARDHLGIVPLYMGRDAAGTRYVASEVKALTPVCVEVEEFPPGHVMDSRTGACERWYDRGWMHEVPAVSSRPASSRAEAAGRVREALEAAVHRQLMSDVPYGALLSGGLDSSIIAAVAARYSHHRIEDGDATEAWWPRLHTFAIGLDDSPDLERAREVADHIGSVHHGFVYTIQEGLDALSDAIRHMETYDVTTIRAGTPMYLLSRRVRSTGVKMVLSGEGADEVFGGYLYFHKAPDREAFHEETVRKLDRLHRFDCLRANKAMAAWGVEARVPFLDREFLDVAMSLDPSVKVIRPVAGEPGDRRIAEKQVLRDAFRDLLPASVATRQKEQFSDGVGYGWIDALRAHAEDRVSDAQLAAAAGRFPVNTPDTKEGYLYREIWSSHFPDLAAHLVPGGKSVACSTPEALAWDASFADSADPSGRAVKGVHEAAYAGRSAP